VSRASGRTCAAPDKGANEARCARILWKPLQVSWGVGLHTSRGFSQAVGYVSTNGDDESDNEWMRAYLDGDDPPLVSVPYFFLTGLPFDSPVWIEPAVIDAIGVPTDASYFTLGVSGVEHVLERRGSSEQTQLLTRMARAILSRPQYVQRYDDTSQKFAVVWVASPMSRLGCWWRLNCDRPTPAETRSVSRRSTKCGHAFSTIG